MALGVGDYRNHLVNPPDRDPSLLPVHVTRIHCRQVWTVEQCLRTLEADSVLPGVDKRFMRVPLEFSIAHLYLHKYVQLERHQVTIPQCMQQAGTKTSPRDVGKGLESGYLSDHWLILERTLTRE